MQRIQRGLLFTRQAWKMIIANQALSRPLVFTALTGLFVMIVGFIPLGLLVFFLRKTIVGQVLSGFWLGLLLFTLAMVGTLFSNQVIKPVWGALTGQDAGAFPGQADGWKDELVLAISAPVRMMAQRITSILPGQDVAETDRSHWVEAPFLLQPVMAIDQLTLDEAIRRVAQIVKENVLLINPSLVGVEVVNTIVWLILGGGGSMLAGIIGIKLVAASMGAIPGMLVGIAIGILIAAIALLAAGILTSFTASVYHSCLYFWACEVERVRQEGTARTISAPDPLASVLNVM